MDAAYTVDQWREFAVALATASGALAGLVFVAVSINLRTVLADRFHRRRAESTFLILLVVLGLSLVLLFPGQGRVAAGVESLVVGAALEVRAARTWPLVWAGSRREARWSWAVAVVGNLLILVGGIGLLAREGGGLYLVASGLVIVLIRAVYDIWMLFTVATVSDQARVPNGSAAGRTPD